MLCRWQQDQLGCHCRDSSGSRGAWASEMGKEMDRNGGTSGVFLEVEFTKWLMGWRKEKNLSYSPEL